MAGAYRGAEALPGKWIEAVQAASPVDQQELARDLYRVITKLMDESESRLALLKGML